MEKRVAFFKNHILPASEAWLYHQLRSLTRYKLGAFGRRAANSEVFPLDQLRVVRDDGALLRRAEEIYFVLARRSPTLQRALRRFDPHLIHAHFGVDGIYAMAFAKRLDTPLAVSFYGYDASRLPAPRLYPVSHLHYFLRYGQLGENASLLIAYTRFLAERLIEKGMPQEKIRVHYMGIPVRDFSLDTPNPARPKNVLFVGRFVEKKGLHHLVSAFQCVSKQVPDSKLLLVGDGPLRAHLERQVDGLGISQRVHFAGPVPHSSLRDWHSRSVVFAHPSVTAADGETEGLPFSILEAQAAGLPVVATRHAGIPEGVIHDKTGVLLPEGDVEGIAEALLLLLQDDQRRDEMAREAIAFMHERFDVHECTRALESLYDEVCAR